ncbi:Kelch repeat-containing protein [Emticicia agri]|nr:hypothetical protein [Emticicia agri]
MKRIILFSLILFSLVGKQHLYAQSGTITTEGVYVPQLTTAERNAIATPANGQMIYNTDDNCFNVYQNGTWGKLIGFDVLVPDFWIQKSNVGGSGRSRAVGFSIGNKGYIGTGTTGQNFTKDFWEYDPTTFVWTQKADFGGSARQEAVGFSIANKGYIGTGNEGILNANFVNRKDLWEYDPSTNSWTEKASLPGNTVRNGAVGFSIGTKGYIGLGSLDKNTYLNDLWEYDPAADTWTQRAVFPAQFRANAVGLAIGTKGYVGMGVLPNGFSMVADFWEFNPVSNTWVQKAYYPGNAYADAVGFSIGNKGYVGTGYSFNSEKRNSFWEYEPMADTWTQMANFGGTPRNGATGFSINGIGYIGTGFDGVLRNDFWAFDPNTIFKGITTQGNVFNGPNQLVQLDGSGNIAGNLTLTGDVSVSGKLNPENFIAPTLLNSWVNYSTPTYEAAGYAKDKESRVKLKGTIKNGTAASGTTLFNLPVGYRPTEILMFAVTNSATALGRVDVYPNGDVKIMSGGNTLLSLDAIAFKVN